MPELIPYCSCHACFNKKTAGRYSGLSWKQISRLVYSQQSINIAIKKWRQKLKKLIFIDYNIRLWTSWIYAVILICCRLRKPLPCTIYYKSRESRISTTMNQALACKKQNMHFKSKYWPDGILHFKFETSSSLFIHNLIFINLILIRVRVERTRLHTEEVRQLSKAKAITEISYYSGYLYLYTSLLYLFFLLLNPDNQQ